MSHKLVSLHIGDGEYYTRIDADNVIAEKDAEIARLKDIRKVLVEAIESMGAGLLQDYDEIHHQKFKRCVSNAELCSCMQEQCGFLEIQKWEKREKKWRGIAEKLKESK